MPEIRARALDEFARTIDVTASVLARRGGRAAADDVTVRALAGAIFGVIMASTLPVLEQGRIDLDAIFASIDAGLAQLKARLPALTARPARLSGRRAGGTAR